MKLIRRETYKLGELVEDIAKQFKKAGLHFGHGTDNAVDEAYFLVAGALKLLGKPLDEIWNLSVTKLSRDRLFKMVEIRIRERKPVAYLLGKTTFAELLFKVPPMVLIPRSPFGELIIKKFHPWVNLSTLRTVLDLGTGSGCMAIAVAKYFPHLQVDATDISFKALNCAEKNARLHKVSVNFWQSDLFEKIEKKYDLIISNPPYVGRDELNNLPIEYLHEPGLALFGGETGAEMVIKIIEKAAEHLTPHGQLIIEVGNSLPFIEKHFKIPFVQLEFEYGESEILLFEASDLKKLEAI